MRFRPCIDIHNGKIKQIVGGSLLDQGDFATENFVSEKDGTFYGKLYKENHLNGGMPEIRSTTKKIRYRH